MTREGTTLEDGSYENGHGLRNASAISGALLGATTGMLGGIAGVGAAGLLGAVIGGLAGLALERHAREAGEKPLEDDAKWAALIEPPCPDCAEVMSASGGTVTSCARHSKKRESGHLHFEYPQSFANGSLLFRPTF